MACERCWGDAYQRSLTDPTKTQSEHYRDLLEERKELQAVCVRCGGLWERPCGNRDGFCPSCVEGMFDELRESVEPTK
jgi:rubrerythrin